MNIEWNAQRLGSLAIVTAFLTGAAGTLVGGSGWHLYGAAAYVALALGALTAPALIAVQVIAGQMLVASLMLLPEGPPHLLLLTMVIGVVATADLLAIVARLRTSVSFDPREDVHRVVLSGLVAGVTFGVVALAGGLRGATGHAGIALASAACVILALVLASDAGRHARHRQTS